MWYLWEIYTKYAKRKSAPVCVCMREREGERERERERFSLIS